MTESERAGAEVMTPAEQIAELKQHLEQSRDERARAILRGASAAEIATYDKYILILQERIRELQNA